MALMMLSEAARATGATVSAIFVPPPFAGDAILEAVDADLDLAVAITEGIPIRDMIRVKRAMQGRRTRLVGPNCPGLVTPGTGPGSKGGCRIEAKGFGGSGNNSGSPQWFKAMAHSPPDAQMPANAEKESAGHPRCGGRSCGVTWR